jgi:hypothetical protein
MKCSNYILITILNSSSIFKTKYQLLALTNILEHTTSKFKHPKILQQKKPHQL